MKKEPTLEQKMAKLEEDGDPLVVGDENPLPSLKSIEAIDDHKVLLDICKRHGLPTSGNTAQKKKIICEQIKTKKKEHKDALDKKLAKTIVDTEPTWKLEFKVSDAAAAAGGWVCGWVGGDGRVRGGPRREAGTTEGGRGLPKHVWMRTKSSPDCRRHISRARPPRCQISMAMQAPDSKGKGPATIKKLMEPVWWQGCPEPNTSYAIAEKMIALTKATDALSDQRRALIVQWRKVKTDTVSESSSDEVGNP